MTQRYLTVREAAAQLRVHDRTVRAMLRDGRLTRYTIKTERSHRVRLDEDEVLRLVEKEPVRT
jgi:excisionase family DNA binding protein